MMQLHENICEDILRKFEDFDHLGVDGDFMSWKPWILKQPFPQVQSGVITVHAFFQVAC